MLKCKFCDRTFADTPEGITIYYIHLRDKHQVEKEEASELSVSKNKQSGRQPTSKLDWMLEGPGA